MIAKIKDPKPGSHCFFIALDNGSVWCVFEDGTQNVFAERMTIGVDDDSLNIANPDGPGEGRRWATVADLNGWTTITDETRTA